MSNEWPQPAKTLEFPKLTKVEKVEALKGVNINDADVLEKIAEICGTDVKYFNENDVISLRKNAEEGGHQPLEWSSTSTEDKFFVEDDGTIVLGDISKN